jgi:hypothetical protein
VHEDGRLAADLFTFVDDLRPTGPGEKECRLAARRLVSMLNWLGIQDAARKRSDSSQTPGAWTGAVLLVNPDGVFALSDEEKWRNKANGMLRLEQIRVILLYVTRTYPCMVPYLIGFHLTIDRWRSKRDEKG